MAAFTDASGRLNAFIAPCSRCGEDTELYLNNFPICLRCSEALEHESERKRSNQKLKMRPPQESGPKT